MNSQMIRIPFMYILVVAALLIFAGVAGAQTAESNFKSKCASCHGPDGKGGTAVGKTLGVHDFTSDAVQKQTDAQLSETISKGKNKMPAYGSRLKENDIKDLVAYIRQLAKPK